LLAAAGSVRLSALAVVLSFVACVACADGERAPLVTPSAAATSAASGPSVSIEQPTDDATIPPGNVSVVAKIQGFQVGAAEGRQGHVIFYKAVDFVPTEAGRPAFTAVGTYETATEATHNWTGVPEGKTSFAVQLVNDDNTPLSPPQTDLVVVTVSASASAASTVPSATTNPSGAANPSGTAGREPAGAANIAIRSPRGEADVPSGKVEVSVDVQGFRLVAKAGKQAKQGEGHIIYYLGDDYEVPVAAGAPATSGGRGAFTSASSASTSYTWSSVAAGRQKFAAQLVSNDDTPLDPPQFAEVVVRVRG
jgi:hypothetical protein